MTYLALFVVALIVVAALAAVVGTAVGGFFAIYHVAWRFDWPRWLEATAYFMWLVVIVWVSLIADA